MESVNTMGNFATYTNYGVVVSAGSYSLHFITYITNYSVIVSAGSYSLHFITHITNYGVVVSAGSIVCILLHTSQ